MNFVGIAVFAAAMFVLVVVVGNSMSYNNNVSSAENFYNSGKYDQAYEKLAGLTLKEKDIPLYNKLRTIMSIYGDYTSYQNLTKVHLTAEALDCLINGYLHYDEYYAFAEEYEVTEEFDTIYQSIIYTLQQYGITEDEVLYLSEIENLDQYYEILASYGGSAE